MKLTMFKRAQLTVSNESESFLLTNLLLHPDHDSTEIMNWLSTLSFSLSNQTRFDYHFFQLLENQPFSNFNFLWILKSEEIRVSKEPLTTFTIHYQDKTFTSPFFEMERMECHKFLTLLIHS